QLTEPAATSLSGQTLRVSELAVDHVELEAVRGCAGGGLSVQDVVVQRRDLLAVLLDLLDVAAELGTLGSAQLVGDRLLLRLHRCQGVARDVALQPLDPRQRRDRRLEALLEARGRAAGNE